MIQIEPTSFGGVALTSFSHITAAWYIARICLAPMCGDNYLPRWEPMVWPTEAVCKAEARKVQKWWDVWAKDAKLGQYPHIKADPNVRFRCHDPRDVGQPVNDNDD